MTSTAVRPWPRALHNVVIALLLLVLLLDGLPSKAEGHKRIKRWMAPVIDAVGLAQGSWQLFAPDPDRLNSWVEARVSYSDGSSWAFRTPDWLKRGALEKIMQGRHPKFWDAFRRDDWRVLWPHIADYAVRIAPPKPEGVKPVKVVLIRHWWDVPPPAKLAMERKKFGALPPPQDAFPGKFEYFSKVIP